MHSTSQPFPLPNLQVLPFLWCNKMKAVTEVKQCDWLFVLVSVVCVDPALWAAASPGASCSVGHQVIHNPAKFKEAKCEAGEVM